MHLKVTTSIPLGEPDADAGLITWLDVNVIHHEDEDEETEQVIGEARIALVHVAEAGNQLVDALDADSGELEALSGHYFDGDWIKDELSEGKGTDLLYVSELDVHEKWQNRNIELAVVRRICDTLGQGCELAVIPYETDEELARWQQMGFEPTTSPSKGDCGYLHLQLALTHPRIEESESRGRFHVIPIPPSRSTE